MPRADQGGRPARKTTGVRADGTPRRAPHSETPRRASRAGTGSAAGSGRAGGAETPSTGRASGGAVSGARAVDAAGREGGARSSGSPRAGATRASGGAAATGGDGAARSATSARGGAPRASDGRDGTSRTGGYVSAARKPVPRGGASRAGEVATRDGTTGRGTSRAGGTVTRDGAAARGASRPGDAVSRTNRAATSGDRKARPSDASPAGRRTGASGAAAAQPSVTRRSDPRPQVVRSSGTAPAEGPERLQKVLAAAGVGSRRACEELILAGRVTVDGKRAELGDRADPRTAAIHVDGERIVTDATRLYLAINKPAGVVTTMADDQGRAALADYLGNVPQRVYHVGRLDKESEGLLLLTNDGSLAHKLMHPSYRVLKTYLAEVTGPVRPGLKRRLTSGVELEDGVVAVDGFRVVDTSGGRALVEIVLHEGRKHVVRRLLAEVGHPVSRLVRTQIGPVKLGDLRSGRNRRLTPAEVADLFRAVGD